MADGRTGNRSASETTARPPVFGPGSGRGPGGRIGGLGGAGGQAKDTGATLARLWRYLKHQKWLLLVTIVLVALSSLLSLAGPYLMGIALDQYIYQGDVPSLVRTALLMIAAYLGSSLARWLQTYVMAAVAQGTVRDIRNDLFGKLQTLSLRYFDRHTHGELMSRLSNDVENISNVLNNGVTQLVSSALGVLGVVIAMCVINWRLALVSLITVPLMVLLTGAVGKRAREGYRAQQEKLGRLNGHIEETISGQRVVKAYVREDEVIDEFERTNSELRDASTRAETFSGFVGPMMNFVNNLGFAIIAGFGGWMALRGFASVGNIASFITYARQMARPINQIAQLYGQLQGAIAGAERVFEILDEVPEISDAPDALPMETVNGDVVFNDVWFGYDDEPVLKDVSFHALPGQSFALVGPTGAGKTTIVNLLTRFYDIDKGAIAIDGKDIRMLKKVDLRQKLGIVLQDTFLFSDTVMENIRYGRLDASDEEVVEAAKLANADHFIRRLPDGYQTELSERGSSLSQGQRQLLAIARAILADPAILILDEATSSVDTRTEKNLQQAMLRLMEGRTAFVIAHRLSTIREADQILVINEGRIEERGTHSSLLANRGFYHNLYTSQFKGQTAAV